MKNNLTNFEQKTKMIFNGVLVAVVISSVTLVLIAQFK